MLRKSTKKSEKKFTAIPTLKLPKTATVRAEPAKASTDAAAKPVVAVTATRAVTAPTTTVAAPVPAVKAIEPGAVATSISDPNEDHMAAVAATILALRNSDADIARDAATELGRLGDRSAIETLTDVLANVDGYYHAVVRAAAAESLGVLADPRSVNALLMAITDPMVEVSSEAIRALAAIGDEHAVDAMIDVIRNRTGYFLPVARRTAVVALAKLGGARAQAELLSIAQNTFEEPAIRDAAAQR